MNSKIQINRRGFTIVELLVVIVVIGILAAVTIVAFNGVQRRAIVASLQSDLNGASRTLEALKITGSNELYPVDSAAAGLKASSGSTIQYSYYSDSNTYCVTANNGLIAYFIETGGKPTEGNCPGHTVGEGTPVPTPTFQNLTATTLTAAGTRAWKGVTISDDGQKIAAIVENGFVYTSTNGGTAWTERGVSRWWRDIAGSADGVRLLAVTATAGTMSAFSSADSGATWTDHALCTGTCQFKAVDISADGQKMAVVLGNGSNTGRLWVSNDAGATWIERQSGQSSYTDVAISDDGQTILTTAAGSIYMRRSFDNGATWSSATGGNASPYQSVSCNSTCSTIFTNRYVSGGSSAAYYSTNHGTTMQTPTGLVGEQFSAGAAISSDGQKIVVASNGGNIYTSTTAGTFVARPAFGTASPWYEVAGTPNGATFIVANGTSLQIGKWD